ncbi:MAG: serine/threonine protein kinase [Deltaproteobacteria bacterium]|nr:MAG: serine/threonine protein kinase [Deltaproteobacteria bacterium]
MPRMLYIGACIGRGQFGEVYEAKLQTDGGLLLPVAIKVLHGQAPAAADAVSRFRDEARLVAELAHPGIATAYDLCRVDGKLALITELVRGPDIGTATTRSIPPVRAVLEAFAQVANTLADCHAAQDTFGAPMRIVHRDVKPSNILVDRTGQVKLIDFGVALFQGPERLTRSVDSHVIGSLSFMSPERFDRRSRGHARWDVYALGASLYKCLAGRPVMGKRGIGEVLGLAGSAMMWNQRVVGAMRGLREDVPPPVWSVLMRCLRHEGKDRPSAVEVADALDASARGVDGPGLRQWARDLRMPPEMPDAEFSGKQFPVGHPDDFERDNTSEW